MSFKYFNIVKISLRISFNDSSLAAYMFVSFFERMTFRTHLSKQSAAGPLIFKGLTKYIYFSGLNFEINFTETWKEELVQQTGRK